MAQPESTTVKLILLGDPECGKTSLLVRFCKDEFHSDKEVTIDNAFESRTFNTAFGDRDVQVWDTAGEERFRNLTSSTYRGAQGIILVYDMTNPESFENLPNWVSDIKLQRGVVGKDVPTVVVGNKSDLDERQIPTDSGKQFADKHSLPFFETSAKTGSNVDDAFRTLIEIIVKPREEKVPEPIPADTAGESQAAAKKRRIEEQIRQEESKGCCIVV